MSEMTNRATELPDDREDEIPDIDVPLDREAIVSMFEENLEHCGTEYAMDLIENSGEMAWLVEKAERRMLEICAERLRKFNTSDRAVEWFRDYHGLNNDEAKEAVGKTDEVIDFEQNELPALIPEDYDGPLTPKLEILSNRKRQKLRFLLAEVVLDIDKNQSKGRIKSDLMVEVFNCYKEVMGYTAKWNKVTGDVLFNAFFS